MATVHTTHHLYDPGAHHPHNIIRTILWTGTGGRPEVVGRPTLRWLTAGEESADPEVRGVTGVLWVLCVFGVFCYRGHPRNLDSAEKSGVDEQHF